MGDGLSFPETPRIREGGGDSLQASINLGKFSFTGNLGKTETARRSSYGEVRDKKRNNLPVPFSSLK